jgi:hypothetical protein
LNSAPSITPRSSAGTISPPGSETTADARTAVAYFDRHVALVTLVTDPGSPHPPLDSGFVAGLLTTAVAALRG